MGNPPLVVLYEDERIVAVAKAAGMHTAPLSRGETGTLLQLVIDRFPEIASVPGVKPVEPGLLHRLDRGTSGIVLVARTEATFRELREAGGRGLVVKDYLAVCVGAGGAGGAGGAAGAATFRVESRFAPYGPGRQRVRVVPAGAAGRAAREATRRVYTTEGEVVATRGGLLLVRARITEGFRHQVRVHLAHLGMPILGDPLYSASPAPRMFLHASAVELPRAPGESALRIACPPPPEFAATFGVPADGL